MAASRAGWSEGAEPWERAGWPKDARSSEAAGWSEDDLERDLIAEARRDRAAFAALYRRHYAAIAGYVHRRVGDVHATEDLVAEAFLAAMRSIGGYRSRGVPFRAWLYRIATNVVNRWAKSRRRQLRRECSLTVLVSDAGAEVDVEGARRNGSAEPWAIVAPGDPAAIAVNFGAAGFPDNRCERNGAAVQQAAANEAEIARRALQMLPPRQQAVVALHYLEGLPIEEVASIVGCRVGTVKSRLSRGREALREMLERRR